MKTALAWAILAPVIVAAIPFVVVLCIVCLIFGLIRWAANQVEIEWP